MADAICITETGHYRPYTYSQVNYGRDHIAIAVPAVLRENGIEDIIQLDLNESEQAIFRHSASLVREDIDMLKSITWAVHRNPHCML